MKIKDVKVKEIIVFRTKEDFDMLENLPFNRKPKYRKDLAEKMMQYTFVGAIIIIRTKLFSGSDRKERLYSADGQHRAIVAREHGIECIGIVVDYDFKSQAEIVKFVASLNSTQVEWSLTNYIDAYLYLKYVAYEMLVEIKNKCHYTFGAIASMLHGFRTKGAVGKHIEDGTFTCNSVEETENTLKLAKKLSKYGSLTSRMVLALHNVSMLKSFDEEKFTLAYRMNYERVREMKLDDYSDEFAKWLN